MPSYAFAAWRKYRVKSIKGGVDDGDDDGDDEDDDDGDDDEGCEAWSSGCSWM